MAEIKIVIPTMYTYVLDSSRGSKYPNDYGEAENNPPYVMAAMMLHGRVYVEQFSDSVLRDPKMEEVAGKVVVEVDPSLDKIFQGTDKSPAQVKITLKDRKKELFDAADYPRGSPQNPATPEEIENKFVELAGIVLKKDKAREIARMVRKLERLDNLRDFIRLLIA